jgi:hypothetical protein
MSPFHVVSILAVVLVVVVCTVGDDVATCIRNMFCMLNPTERDLMRICDQVRRL